MEGYKENWGDLNMTLVNRNNLVNESIDYEKYLNS